MYFELENFKKNCDTLYFRFSNLKIFFLYTKLWLALFPIDVSELEIFKKNCDNLYLDIYIYIYISQNLEKI